MASVHATLLSQKSLLRDGGCANTLKLDAGCGSTPQGDVNCDLFIRDPGHRTGKRDKPGEILDPKRIKNFVVCDVERLPFRDEVFDEVYASHVIEHVNDPALFLHELLRVSSLHVTVLCPHRIGDKLLNPPNPFHKNYFGARWFETAMRVLGCSGVVTISQVKTWPSNLVHLLHVPFEIRADFYKSKVLSYGYKDSQNP